MPEGGFWDKTSMAAFVCLAALEGQKDISFLKASFWFDFVFTYQKTPVEAIDFLII
ncbi:2332_t:CDS:2 [Entrophospora sp. SA101]|nr:2332_t:CDS:2 [Entrophospora sp. SA101]CAJ0843980.1 7345_t:CDS:2 [Entrophospora sp. SA101]CAJ0921277.1 14922_t:CDS:2 [Entrophospora sp. SA101]